MYGSATSITGLHARASELTKLAHEMVLKTLQKNGNGISPDHAFALRQLVSGFTEQGLGINKGRVAYALPCGAGKTLSIVAWIAAQYHLKLGLSIAVSAQQIDALCCIKFDLIEAGVPENLIGIRHTKGKEATYPDTGDDDRPIMLGSHARIRGAEEMPAFCRYRGAARDLLIWDESLISADTTVLDLSYTETALMHFAKGASRPLLQAILTRLRTEVEVEKAAQASGKAPRILTLLDETESEAALAQIGRPYCATPGERNLIEAVQKALRLMAHPVSLLDAGAGDTGIGLMRYQIMVDPELENIAVLDASFVVRELCKADPTIRNGTTTAMQEFKSYEDVLVKHSVAPSGRCQFVGSKADRRQALQVAVDSIRSIPKGEHILLFTYKEDRPADLIALLKEELRAEGIDPEEILPSKKPRFAFSTWGRHTTDNSYRYCEHVVLLGVLRMPRLQLGAAMAGQKNDYSYRMSGKDLLAVEHSELVSNILQAANRGCCRLVDAEGKAVGMTIHLLTKERQLQPLLEKAMPGLQWQTLTVDTGTEDKPLTRTRHAAQQIVDYVDSLSEQVLKVSLKVIYAHTGITLRKDAKAEAVSMALIRLQLNAIRRQQLSWVREDLSLARKAG
jgi:hypothetical protein